LSNQAILRLHTRHELFHEICRIAVEYGGFALAWVGWIDAETRQVVPVEQYGEHSAFLSHAPMTGRMDAAPRDRLFAAENPISAMTTLTIPPPSYGAMRPKNAASWPAVSFPSA
jgi:hypothetical protein